MLVILRSKFSSIHHTRGSSDRHEGDDSNNIGKILVSFNVKNLLNNFILFFEHRRN